MGRLVFKFMLLSFLSPLWSRVSSILTCHFFPSAFLPGCLLFKEELSHSWPPPWQCCLSPVGSALPGHRMPPWWMPLHQNSSKSGRHGCERYIAFSVAPALYQGSLLSVKCLAMSWPSQLPKHLFSNQKSNGFTAAEQGTCRPHQVIYGPCKVSTGPVESLLHKAWLA